MMNLRRHFKVDISESRIRILSVFFLLVAIIIIIRLFFLQVIQHDYYSLFALNTHEITKKLYPTRGAVYFQDTRTKQEYPAAVNREYFLLYGSPREMSQFDLVSSTNRLAELIGSSSSTFASELLAKLSAPGKIYVPLAKKVLPEVVDVLKANPIPGIHYTSQSYRFYPEEHLAASVLGFVGSDAKGSLTGRYGLEGYWEKKLAGKGGLIAGEQGALGSWITLGNRTYIAPEDGPDVHLSIDRTLEYGACERLRQGLKEYEAKSAALVMMNPKTGAILAMCSLPDFDPNNYSDVSDIAVYNNTSIFTPYEPGSVFKPITMAAGLDLGLVTPNTTYTDPCERIINGYHVRNAEQKCYGVQTMTEVLEKSINTGVVWLEEKLGNERFKHYVSLFGFGQKTGITLNSEAAGDTSSLDKKGQIFGANGSFGQGITVTPLQLAAAYSAIANDGKLMRPFVVDDVSYPNGRHERTTPEALGQIIAPRAAKLLSGMLVSVVENHYHAAKIPGYFIAGKTGTAQIPEKGAYSANRTNHTFAGFGPENDPQIVLVVKYEEPARKWAEQTALPVFRDVMKFALDYYGVPHER